jgi:hypothetical protein
MQQGWWRFPKINRRSALSDVPALGHEGLGGAAGTVAAARLLPPNDKTPSKKAKLEQKPYAAKMCWASQRNFAPLR